MRLGFSVPLEIMQTCVRKTAKGEGVVFFIRHFAEAYGMPETLSSYHKCIFSFSFSSVSICTVTFLSQSFSFAHSPPLPLLPALIA
jgi:hypothetical protein